MDISVLKEHSQTFIGVIASLLLITIIWSHESNFVMKIINERSEAIKEIWRSLNESIGKRSKKWKFLKPSTELMFQEMENMYVNDNSENQTIHLNEQERNQIQLLDEKIETGKEIFITAYSHTTMPLINKKIESIKASKKIVVSAIFALMSCLMVFIADEAMAIFPSIRDYCVSFLCLFLIIGSAFGLGMWGSFFIRHLPWLSDETLKHENDGVIKNASSFQLIAILTCIMLVFCLVGNFISPIWIKRCIVFGVGMILPIICLGTFKILHRDYTENHPYSFAINHFIEFCELAVIWSIILFFGEKVFSGLSEVFFIYTDWKPLLLFLELYLIFFGIIFPIFIPYLNTYILQWYMKSRLYEPKRLINKEKRWETLNKEIEDLYKTITKK